MESPRPIPVALAGEPWLANPGKLLEQACLILRGDPGPAVAYLDAHERTDMRRPHHDGAAGICVLDGVGQVVRHGLAQQPLDAANRW
jgi:hypothetical protein